MGRGSPEDLLLVGTVIRPHGVEGRLRIKSYARGEESFLHRGIVFLRTVSGETREHPVVSVSPHKNVLLFKLEGVNSLEQAEEYRGADVLIERETSAPDEEEEFFWHELIGLRVYLNTGRCLGTLSYILETSGNDIYVVRDGDKEVLIPAIHEVVKEIDLKDGKIIISEMEGLLDLNEV